MATSSVYFQFGNAQTQSNQPKTVYSKSTSLSSVNYGNNAQDNDRAESGQYGQSVLGNYQVVRSAPLNDYDVGANADTYNTGISDEYATGGQSAAPASNDYDGVVAGSVQYSEDAYENGAGSGISGAVPVAVPTQTYARQSAIASDYASYGNVPSANTPYGNGVVSYSPVYSAYKTGGGCGSANCGSYQSGAVFRYPAASTAYQTGRSYGPVFYRPVPYIQAPLALSPVLVPRPVHIPVALAPISDSHGSSSSGGKFAGLSEKFSGLDKLGGGLEKLIDLEKLEKLLPLDLLKSIPVKNIRLPSKPNFDLNGLFSALANIDIPSLTVKLPDGSGASEFIDKLLAASDQLFPAIKFPSKVPLIASSPIQAHGHIAHQIPTVSIRSPIKLNKQMPNLDLSKLKLPELPSLSSFTSGLSEGLNDLLSKLTGKFENVKKEKTSAPVMAPVAPVVSAPIPRKIVTAYPIQRGPLNGHVVIEDFPYGAGPFEGGEPSLGCAELDGAVPVSAPFAKAY